VIDTPDVFIASSNVPWGLLNAAFLPKPVETEAALERSVAAAAQYFTPRKQGWIYILCDDWLAPGLRAKAPAVLEAHGLKLAMGSQGMVAEHLAPPVRPPPALELRLATDTEALRHIADINAIAYASPLEVARESVAVSAVFQGNCQGYVGFMDGEAVSVAAIIRVDGVAYVGYVATLAEHRQRGYAETVMRHGLADARRNWGTDRTVLHATDAGRPLYLSMGYRDVTRFGFYMPVPSGP
jgi:ribosomal protein S18 acetylase RimI-like enzyme